MELPTVLSRMVEMNPVSLQRHRPSVYEKSTLRLLDSSLVYWVFRIRL
jgi:hypothetical protein